MTGDLRAVREVWALRGQARTRADLLYLLYVVVLSVLVFAAPALRMSGTFLARPDVLPALLHPLAPQVATSVSLAAAGAMVMLGALRGPALLAPFFTATLAASGIRRRDVLWRPLARALLVPGLSAVTVTVLIAVTLVSDGAAMGEDAAWFVVAGAGTGLLLGAAWLAGELFGAGVRRLLAGGLLAAAALCTVLPSAPGLGGVYPVGAARPMLWALLLLGIGIVTTAAGFTQLDRLLPAALAPVMIAGRGRDAAKGPMPLSLSTPMPTPQGDMAVIPMLAWQADAILLAMVSGAVLAGLGRLGLPWLLGGAAVLTASMALMARFRLRALRR